jgi:hypothetical protein
MWRAALVCHRHPQRQTVECCDFLALALGANKSIRFIALDQRPLP